ncbi:hypothetical protein [Acetivibrio ethanolgignens]|uniref:Uncharacterized protein n=1 Tax=Acetivibrio ethanolgignens TaxID=290052 RepID=A0A0V8QFL7_9FIRM|nr:hypothetical protein [Acetivibrio ethanolgignens]KSV59400.1 hypothetical protein ASU35_09190 [Acetivibrio ethanolgignens]
MKKKIGIIIGILVAALCCVGLYRMHLTRKAGFVVEDHLEDTLLTIGGEKVTLRDSLYYIMLVENESNEKAESYSEAAKKSFWNIKTGDEGYVSQVAKKVILQQMIKDEILYQEAVKNDWEIDDTQVKNAVTQVWAEMSPYQKELTGYTRESLEERLKKAYAGQAYGEVYGEDFDEIKEEYQVTVDEKLWESIEMGRVTLENKEDTE